MIFFVRSTCQLTNTLQNEDSHENRIPIGCLSYEKFAPIMNVCNKCALELILYVFTLKSRALFIKVHLCKLIFVCSFVLYTVLQKDILLKSVTFCFNFVINFTFAKMRYCKIKSCDNFKGVQNAQIQMFRLIDR